MRPLFLLLQLLILISCSKKEANYPQATPPYNTHPGLNSKIHQEKAIKIAQTIATPDLRRIILEIHERPKKEFLEDIYSTSTLTNEQKAIVQEGISPDVYTHCKLVLYQLDGRTCLDIDQYYLTISAENDGSGDQSVLRLPGSQSHYEFIDGQWMLIGGVNYD